MITKAALILFREHEGRRELMFVRAHNKPFFVFPGGKQDPGETIEQALERELQEELSCTSSDYKPLGVVEGQTPDGRPMQMHLYSATLEGTPKPSAEIVEVAWMDEQAILQHQQAMTPMTMTKVLPVLESMGLFGAARDTPTA